MPLDCTLLASDLKMGRMTPVRLPPLDTLATVSTMTEDVSWPPSSASLSPVGDISMDVLWSFYENGVFPQTCALDLERRSDDMHLVVLDGHVVVSRQQRRVSYFVAFLDLGTVHSHLGGSIDGDGQGSSASVAGVDDEVRLLAGLDVAEALAGSVHRSRIDVVLTDLDAVRRSRDVHSVELDVDGVDSVLARVETYRVLVLVDQLDEAIVLVVGWGYDLRFGNDS